MSHTWPGSWSHHATPLGERATMNLITDILAGLAHFVGWLV
ncbi:hypothetical protein ACFQ0Q_14635 [Streptomyces aureus]